ncbi:MAG: hypothetical protein WAV41_05200 [Microgenomates group bacterium]
MKSLASRHQLYTAYLLATLALVLPLIGYQTIFSSKAAPVTPPITPPITPIPTLFPQSITVITPTEGDIIHLGKIYVIKWQALTPSATFVITLRNDRGESTMIATTKRPDNFSWRVSVPSTLLDRSQYFQIMVSNTVNLNQVSGLSGKFTITPVNHPPVINLATPVNFRYNQYFSLPFTMTDSDQDKINVFITNLPKTVKYILTDSIDGQVSGQIFGTVSSPATIIIKATDNYGGITKRNLILKQLITPTPTPSPSRAPTPTPIRLPL